VDSPQVGFEKVVFVSASSSRFEAAKLTEKKRYTNVRKGDDNILTFLA
tara:strand:- start:21436 stop:21579 length:144 start_codon:yes stop_codon:yes gene_type:complete